MADEVFTFRLIACRELMDSHPQSLVIRQQVEALEDALPDKPGIAVSFCRTLIETGAFAERFRCVLKSKPTTASVARARISA